MGILRNHKKQSISIIIAILVVLWMIFFFSGIPAVPFHPDESTQIFMSSDLDLIFNDTTELFYKYSASDDEKQSYRLLDAPLTKYTIGLARIIFDQDTLNKDWDWSKSYNENSEALPDQNLLIISRVAVSIFFPLSIYLFFLISKYLFANNKFLIALSVIVFSCNSLLLLHTRRAMAEGLLIFFLLLSLCAFIYLSPDKLWLSSIPIAFAINSKQSLIFLCTSGLLILVLENYKKIKSMLFQLFLFLSIIVGISFVLNPITWKEPLKVTKLMVEQRTELSENQLSAINSVTPDFTTTKFSEKIIAFVAQSFVIKPALLDISNYEADLIQDHQSYLENPLHQGIFRNLFVGVLVFLITCLGFIKSLFSFSKKNLILFSLTFFFFLVEVLFYLNIPFQRYYLPGLPFVLIFFVFGVDQIFDFSNHFLNKFFRK